MYSLLCGVQLCTKVQLWMAHCYYFHSSLERAEGLKVGTTPVAASSSWKPVKAQTKVVKKKKRAKPIGALSKKDRYNGFDCYTNIV